VATTLVMTREISCSGFRFGTEVTCDIWSQVGVGGASNRVDHKPVLHLVAVEGSHGP